MPANPESFNLAKEVFKAKLQERLLKAVGGMGLGAASGLLPSLQTGSIDWPLVGVNALLGAGLSGKGLARDIKEYQQLEKEREQILKSLRDLQKQLG